jgi:MoaA/NifB/PqqE/SkfB family radical SAM enzyme
MTWNYHNTHLVHIELSNRCNAACPLCPRYLNHSLKVNPELDLGSVSLMEFKNWFPLDFIQKSKSWIFCGTNGDPLMARDAYEILEYVSRNSKAKIQINTNGSMRDVKFWSKLGSLFAEPCENSRYVVFSVDGLKDTNHIYRRNVKWDNVMKNMKSFVKSGGMGIWDFLIFKHNEHQLDKAEKMAKKIGVTFSPKRPFGFETHEPDVYQDLMVYDENGNFIYRIEPATEQFRLNKSVKKFEISEDKIWLPTNGKPTKEEIEKKWDNVIDNNLKDFKFPERFKGKAVNCKSCHQAGMEIYVDCKGNVMPCCFVGTMHNSDFQNNETLQIRNEINKYGKDKINLNNYSLQEILDSDYLEVVFASKWENAKSDSDKMVYCFNTCSVDHMKDLFVKKDNLPISEVK